MSHRTKLVIGFSTLLMVTSGCVADETIATGDTIAPVVGGTGGGGESGSGGTSGQGSGGGGPDARGGGGGAAEVGGNPRCCPRDSTLSGCMHLGGANVNAHSCTVICDFWCSENWRVETDAQGCEAWRFEIRKPLPSETRQCLADRGTPPNADARADVNAKDARDAGTDSDEKDADDPGTDDEKDADDPGTDDEKDAD